PSPHAPSSETYPPAVLFSIHTRSHTDTSDPSPVLRSHSSHRQSGPVPCLPSSQATSHRILFSADPPQSHPHEHGCPDLTLHTFYNSPAALLLLFQRKIRHL